MRAKRDGSAPVSSSDLAADDVLLLHPS